MIGVKTGNQQGWGLNNNQVQVIISGIFGDGCVIKTKSKKGLYSTNCIHKEYMQFKEVLLGDLAAKRGIRKNINNGYKKGEIYILNSVVNIDILKLKELTITQQLSLLDNLGLAMWFYDDGSLHKSNHFFNLNTHSYSYQEHIDYLVPFFNSLGLFPKIYKDRKKDGRVFHYLYFGKHDGAFEIMKLLKQYPIDCYNYKLWPSTTIQEWSKLKAELKSRNIEVAPRKFTNILNGVSSI